MRSQLFSGSLSRIRLLPGPGVGAGDPSLSSPRPLTVSPRDYIDRVFKGGLRGLPAGGLELPGEREDRGILGDSLLEPRDQGAEDLGPGGGVFGRDFIDLLCERLE